MRSLELDRAHCCFRSHSLFPNDTLSGTPHIPQGTLVELPYRTTSRRRLPFRRTDPGFRNAKPEASHETRIFRVALGRIQINHSTPKHTIARKNPWRRLIVRRRARIPSDYTDHAQGSTYANDAINVSICQPKTGGLTTLSTFNPEYTEQFFGQNQTIFGYKGLRVQMRFAAHDLYPNVEISYDQKFKSVGDTKATDLLSVLRKFLPEGITVF